jgi:hypothetical protein
MPDSLSWRGLWVSAIAAGHQGLGNPLVKLEVRLATSKAPGAAGASFSRASGTAALGE